MEHKVLGFRLPSLLSHLIDNNDWRMAGETYFEKATGIPPTDIGLQFLAPGQMHDATKSIRRLSYSDPKSFGLISPLTLLKNNKPRELLDTGKCLLIISSMNENYVVLDYRSSNEPEIRATAEINGKLIHKLIAKNFIDFANAIGIHVP